MSDTQQMSRSDVYHWLEPPVVKTSLSLRWFLFTDTIMGLFWCQKVCFAQLAHFMCVDTGPHCARESALHQLVKELSGFVSFSVTISDSEKISLTLDWWSTLKETTESVNKPSFVTLQVLVTNYMHSC